MERRSEPELSLESEAFLWATMNGPSELEMVVDTNKRAVRVQIAGPITQFAIVDQEAVRTGLLGARE